MNVIHSIFQFNNTNRRDSFLSYLLSYLALSPKDSIRRIPENLQEVIQAFPIGHQALTIYLKECKTPQSIDSIRLSIASTRELQVLGSEFEAVSDENGKVLAESDNNGKLTRSKSETRLNRKSKEEKGHFLQAPRKSNNKIEPINGSQESGRSASQSPELDPFSENSSDPEIMKVVDDKLKVQYLHFIHFCVWKHIQMNCCLCCVLRNILINSRWK